LFKTRFFLIAGAAFSFPIVCMAQCTGRAQLNSYERGQFLEVSEGQRAEVSAQFLSEPGCGKPMLDSLKVLGARIEYRDERSGFALVLIARDKLLATLDLPGIEYAYTRDDDRMYYQDPAAKIQQSERKAEPVPAISIPYPRVATTLPPDGPFFDAGVIGLQNLRKEHPEADGRGVRVAVPDEGFDLLHPALQQARDTRGKIVPKIADLGTLTSPDEDAGWVQFGEPVQTANGTFDAAGRDWTAPEDGTFRFGIFKQDLVLGPEGNSHSKRVSLSVGVLWNEANGHVWVDTDGDGSFKNQKALSDYATAQDVDWFGAKKGEDDNRIPFGVNIDSGHHAAYIDIGGEHGAFVGGPLAGNKLTGGLFDGTAPSAQLIDSRSGRATYLADLVAMFARPDVDVINRSGGLGRAGYTGNREGIEDFAQRVVERAIAVYQKPIATYSAATGTIHVNDYAGPEMLKRNRQIGPPYKDTINSFVWWLPNGAVNTVVATSANLETDSRYEPQDLTWEDGKRHNFSDERFNPPAPDGYVIGANNSPTIPVVSGLLADLISEAKHEHIRYNAVRLNNAVFTGTKLLEGIPASQQGYGLVNAERSWQQLSGMAKADDPNNPELTSFTFGEVKEGKTVSVQGFQADLDRAGKTVDGEIQITRHGGYAGPRRYTFALRGDSASYTLLDHEATLIDGKPVRIRFRTNGASGWNLAFLELRDAKADVVMRDVPLSVRAPAKPEQVAPGVDRYQTTLAPLTTQYSYVQAGEDTEAARYVMKIPFTGPENISTRSFPGGRYRTTKAPPGDPVDAAHHVGPVETLSSLVVNDAPGNQEIFWENRGRPEYATQYDGPAPDVPIHAELTVTKYAVALAKTLPQTLSAINHLAAVDGHVELYDAQLATSEFKGQGNHGMAEVERDVPANLAQWRVRVSGPIKAGEADAYLLDCTGKNDCYVTAQQEITEKGALLFVDKPAAGKWKIVVRSREQVTGMPGYKLAEAQLTPTETPSAAQDAQHASAEKWSVALPSTTKYAAFRIAGTPGVEREKNGLVIAMTALAANAP
jgi:hypothetical protein